MRRRVTLAGVGFITPLIGGFWFTWPFVDLTKPPQPLHQNNRFLDKPPGITGV